MDPATPEDVFARLNALGIAHRTVEHAPVFTVEEARATKNTLPGAHTKNLFLKDKAGALVLAVVEAERRVELNALAKRLGRGRFSFASAELLWDVLKVRPGSVTPLALINDREQSVHPLIDKSLIEAEIVNVHPLVNTATTALSPAGLLAFIRACGHDPVIFDFEAGP